MARAPLDTPEQLFHFGGEPAPAVGVPQPDQRIPAGRQQPGLSRRPSSI